MSVFHCIHLKVESRNPHSGFWEYVATFEPEYNYVERLIPRWYWWGKTKARVLTNAMEAYVAARVAAIKAAKNQRGEVRVKEYYDYGNLGPESCIIWKDGKFLVDD